MSRGRKERHLCWGRGTARPTPCPPQDHHSGSSNLCGKVEGVLLSRGAWLRTQCFSGGGFWVQCPFGGPGRGACGLTYSVGIGPTGWLGTAPPPPFCPPACPPPRRSRVRVGPPPRRDGSRSASPALRPGQRCPAHRPGTQPHPPPRPPL